ncbi:MAG TPA: D-glycerate dehydrogenase [Ktedonobacteraceae bacterium]|jgi:glyoxylate reductase|nr:D-glycerate dehydrogenase [Ktedonobacteraceae bacterium]
MSQRPHIFVTQKVPQAAYEILEEVGTLDANQQDNLIWSAGELLQRAPGHDYLYCLVTDTIDARLLEACANATPRLKLVATMAVGFNNIDVNTASRLGIGVTNTPGILDETTADLAFALLLATARRIGEAERYLRAGKFTGWGPSLFCGAEVHHSTLGIIGAGRIGQSMAQRAHGFDMQVLYYNRHRLAREEEEKYHLTYASFNEVLQRADFISLHTPYTPETHHLINAQTLALMKPTAILINTARGAVVDEQALAQALQAGQIAGAGLDVFEREPLVEEALLRMEQVVLVPHIGSASQQTRTNMALMAARNIAAHIRGIQPPNLINPEVMRATKQAGE